MATRRKKKSRPAKSKVKAKAKRPVKAAPKKKSKPKAASKKAAPRKAPQSALIKASLPNPVATAFVVCQPEIGYLGFDKSFGVDVTRSHLFPSRAEAQAMIDAELILAEETSPFHKAEIAKASTVLQPSYRFVSDGNEHLLDVVVLPKGWESVVSFKSAHAALARELKQLSIAAAKRADQFRRTWG